MDLREVPTEPFRRHPWEVSRARFFLRALADGGAFARPVDVLDVGAGDGWFAQQVLAQAPAGTTVTCWDVKYDADQVGEASSTAVRRVREQPARQFPVVLALDVIEHVEDDFEMLEQLVRTNLEPGGLALISVPAWHALFSKHDRGMLHHRRYSPSRLTEVLDHAGLRVLMRGGLFHSLLAPRIVSVLRERATGKNDEAAVPEALRWNRGDASYRIVNAALSVDNLISRGAARLGVELPGLTVWALCTW